MTETYFEHPADFELRDHAARSFGLWQEEPIDVVWRFTGDAVRDARAYQFHPTQSIEDQPDGSVIVRFRAGGLREMAWHLFTWGDQVEILEPAELRESLIELLRSAADRHGSDT